MVRTFLIDIDKKIDWEIRQKGLDDYRPLRDHNIDAFGIVKLKRGKLAYIYDIILDDKAIEAAKKDKLFLEKCNFVYKNKSFKGTFIDALTFIKKEF